MLGWGDPRFAGRALRLASDAGMGLAGLAGDDIMIFETASIRETAA